MLSSLWRHRLRPLPPSHLIPFPSSRPHIDNRFFSNLATLCFNAFLTIYSADVLGPSCPGSAALQQFRLALLAKCTASVYRISASQLYRLQANVSDIHPTSFPFLDWKLRVSKSCVGSHHNCYTHFRGTYSGNEIHPRPSATYTTAMRSRSLVTSDLAAITPIETHHNERLKCHRSISIPAPPCQGFNGFWSSPPLVRGAPRLGPVLTTWV